MAFGCSSDVRIPLLVCPVRLSTNYSDIPQVNNNIKVPEDFNFDF